MIWLFFVPFSFLEVGFSGTTQGYFHPCIRAPLALFYVYEIYHLLQPLI
jgi:hypothetical protein